MRKSWKALGKKVNIFLIIKTGKSNVEEVDELVSSTIADGRSRNVSKRRGAQEKTRFQDENYIIVKCCITIWKKFLKLYVWNIALYVFETWTTGKADRKTLEMFELWCYGRMLKTRADKVTNVRKGSGSNEWKKKFAEN